jgi:predicted DNA-binding transcriptional regulator AlpA
VRNKSSQRPSRVLLRERDAADYLNVTEYALQKWRYRGIGPRFVRLGRRTGGAIRYKISDLNEWIANHTVETFDTCSDRVSA